MVIFRSKNRKIHKESLKNSILITNNELVIQAPAGRKSSVDVAALERIREQTLVQVTVSAARLHV